MDAEKVSQIINAGEELNVAELSFVLTVFQQTLQQKIRRNTMNDMRINVVLRSCKQNPINSKITPMIKTDNILQETSKDESFDSWGDIPPPSQDETNSDNGWRSKIGLAEATEKQKENAQSGSRFSEIMAEQKEESHQTKKSLKVGPITEVHNFCGKPRCNCVYSYQGNKDPVHDDHHLIAKNELFISNLPSHLSYSIIRSDLSIKLEGICFPRKTYVPSGKGYAFMTFACHKDAVKAYKKLNTSECFDQNIFVNFSQKKENTHDEYKPTKHHTKQRKYKEK